MEGSREWNLERAWKAVYALPVVKRVGSHTVEPLVLAWPLPGVSLHSASLYAHWALEHALDTWRSYRRTGAVSRVEDLVHPFNTSEMTPTPKNGQLNLEWSLSP